MTIDKFKLHILIAGLIIITNLIIINKINFLGIQFIFPIIFALVLPGLIFALIVNLQKENKAELFVHILGLSLSFLMFGGLLINLVLPLFGITQPLSLIPLLISLDVLLILLLICSFKVSKFTFITFKISRISIHNTVLFIIPFFFPILSIFGTISLNNNSSNIIVMSALVLIALYAILVATFHKKISEFIYPWSIFLMSISLLYLYSLRSWHVIGWDINEENYVFGLTNNNNSWSIGRFIDPYNACLSITILPSILSKLLIISNPEYIFKAVYPVIFSFLPVSLYLLVRKFTSGVNSFLSSFLLISQFWYMEQMTALVRQQIGLLFFSLILLMLFDGTRRVLLNKILLLVFVFSLVVSHYSTYYIFIISMLMAYAMAFLCKVLSRQNKVKQPISYSLMILGLLFAFMWNAQLTQTTGGLTKFLSASLGNIKDSFTTDTLNSGVDRIFFKSLNINNNKNVTDNYVFTTEQYKRMGLDLYNIHTYETYIPSTVYPINNQPAINLQTAQLILEGSKITKFAIVIIFPLIGLLFLAKKMVNTQKAAIKSYILLAISALPLLASIIFLHVFKINYNITRVYIQMLILLAMPTIIGGIYLFSIFNRFRVALLSTLLIIYFFYNSGFTFLLTGGPPSILLNNYGEDFDRFYTHDEDVSSAIWLKKSKDDSLIYADELAHLRLLNFGGITHTIYDVLPSTIDKEAYVYLYSANVSQGKVYKRYDIDRISYTAPLEFLNENKALVYSSTDTRIYK